MKGKSDESTARRVLPIEHIDTSFFWEGTKKNQLLIQRCKQCDSFRHPPAPMCKKCQSLSWDVVESNGVGIVYTYTVVEHPKMPPFEYPNIIALVELSEGVRILSQIIKLSPEEVYIGMPVKVVFHNIDKEVTLPLFCLSE